MSEFSSFRVDAQLNTLANCKNNVENNADVFILIIGGRRGALDPSIGKSIVNLEYQAARNAGLDILVFVDSKVLNLLPIWLQHPRQKFAPVVDSNDVLTFVSDIRKEQRWTFPFGTESDILDVLKKQLSGQFRELLVQRRKGYLNLFEPFRTESEEANRLIRERDYF